MKRGRVQRGVVRWSIPDNSKRDTHAQRRAQSICGALDAEGKPALAFVDRICHQRIARRRAQSFPCTVRPPYRCNGLPTSGLSI